MADRSLLPKNLLVTAETVIFDDTEANLQASDVQAAILRIARRSQINRETITANKQLTATDAGYQHLLSDTPGLEVIYPASPVKDDFFAILVDDDSSENVLVESTYTVVPGGRHEAIYDGVEWVVL